MADSQLDTEYPESSSSDSLDEDDNAHSPPPRQELSPTPPPNIFQWLADIPDDVNDGVNDASSSEGASHPRSPTPSPTTPPPSPHTPTLFETKIVNNNLCGDDPNSPAYELFNSPYKETKAKIPVPKKDKMPGPENTKPTTGPAAKGKGGETTKAADKANGGALIVRGPPTREFHHLGSRPRAPPLVQEHATSTIDLGQLADSQPLSVSEARLLVNAIQAKRRPADRVAHHLESIIKFQESMDAAATFKTKDVVEGVEKVLSAHKTLHPFERAQLGTLCPRTSEEAKAVIPSLATRISDKDLQDLLDEMALYID